MSAYQVLVLTDHRGHSTENSLYGLLSAMRKHPRCAGVEVATRGSAKNADFFNGEDDSPLWGTPVTENFAFSTSGEAMLKGLQKLDRSAYDLVWLRLPPPLSHKLATQLAEVFSDAVIINDPLGIYQAGNKAYMLQFPELCAPMTRCRSIEDIVAFKQQFPIVLKPLRAYGGKGLIKIDGQQVWRGQQEQSWSDFLTEMQEEDEIDYLAVKYLERVGEGDKRILVVNGEILGASLRSPAPGSWLCNVAMGGSSAPGQVTDEERSIVATLQPHLKALGVGMYGIDTLVGEDGKRLLSEINATSIGGVVQMAPINGRPATEKVVDLLWQFFTERQKEKNGS